ncbi:hypothetical protein M942_24550 [Enterobacter ludwigii]|nr:hypothetical protein M942_24550 [Enterobacter ludwigii]
MLVGMTDIQRCYSERRSFFLQIEILMVRFILFSSPLRKAVLVHA